MAGTADTHGHAPGQNRWYRPVYGFNPHRPAFKHRFMAKALGGVMWFWIFYRAKQDGPVLLGLRHPWDGHGHGHHGDEHGHGEEHH